MAPLVFDYIVASEVIYNQDALLPLLKALKALGVSLILHFGCVGNDMYNADCSLSNKRRGDVISASLWPSVRLF